MFKYACSYLSVFLLGAALNTSVIFSSHAEMEVAQHGTINVVGNVAIMMVSLPVSAFYGIDTDKDGKLSMMEFKSYQPTMKDQIKNAIIYSDEYGKQVLQGIKLKRAMANDVSKNNGSQLIITGRFSLKQAHSSFDISIDMFGDKQNEKKVDMVITRMSDNKTQSFSITPETIKHSVFSGT